MMSPNLLQKKLFIYTTKEPFNKQKPHPQSPYPHHTATTTIFHSAFTTNFSFYLWNTGLETQVAYAPKLPPPPYPHPHPPPPPEIIWQFFVELGLPRKHPKTSRFICSALAPKVLCTHPPSVLSVCLLGPFTHPPK